MRNALGQGTGDQRLNLGCVAVHGHFRYDGTTDEYVITAGGRPATAFLFNLISTLQFSGTVPMIDVQAPVADEVVSGCPGLCRGGLYDAGDDFTETAVPSPPSE